MPSHETCQNYYLLGILSWKKKTLKEKNIVILRHWWGCTLDLIIYSDCLDLVWIIFSQKSTMGAMKRLCRGELPSHERMDSVAVMDSVADNWCHGTSIKCANTGVNSQIRTS